MFTSFVPTFQGFGALAITLIALLGAGAAEQGGLMAALIRKIVKVAPAALLAFLIVFVGVLSSVASDAGYLILIPLSAVAFLAVGRHPDCRPRGRVRRCRGHLDGEPDRYAHGCDALRDHERVAWPDRPGLHRHHGRLLLPDRFNHRDDDRGRVHHGEGRRTAASASTTPWMRARRALWWPRKSTRRSTARGLRNVGLALLGVLAVVALCTLPPGAPLT